VLASVPVELDLDFREVSNFTQLKQEQA